MASTVQFPQSGIFSSLFLMLASIHSSQTFQIPLLQKAFFSSLSPCPVSSVGLPSSSSSLLPSFYIFRTLYYNGLWKLYLFLILATSRCICYIIARLIVPNINPIIAPSGLSVFKALRLASSLPLEPLLYLRGPWSIRYFSFLSYRYLLPECISLQSNVQGRTQYYKLPTSSKIKM